MVLGRRGRRGRKGGKAIFLFCNLKVVYLMFNTILNMEPAYHSFEDLFIWKEGLDLSIDTYTLMKNCRDFGLKDQMQRCSVSVPSNIAEGFELHTNRAFIRHLYIAKGSGGELRTQLFIAIRLGYIEKKKGDEMINRTRRLSASISNFIATRKNKLRKE